MTKEEKIDLIRKASQSLKYSTISEEKLDLDKSQFINWMIGLVSAGFLIVFSNMIKIKEVINEEAFLNKTILVLIISSFLVIIISGIIYKIFQNKMFEVYMYIRMLIGLQESNIIKNLDTVNCETDNDYWILIENIYDLNFLPDNDNELIRNKISMYPFKGICKWAYIICIASFILEFGSFFTLFYTYIIN